MRTRLHSTGPIVAIMPDGFIDGGWVLTLDGVEQPHVHLARPEEIFHEYMRRIGTIIDVVAPADTPITALHLGAGALTLARHIAVTRPGSEQIAVESEPELPDFVLRALPLPEGARVRIVVDDARVSLPRVATPGSVDVIVLDVFTGGDVPIHLTEESFYAEAARLFAPGGNIAVNVADDAGLGFFTEQVRAMRSVFAVVWFLADGQLLSGEHPGNLILVGGHCPLAREWAARFEAAGPHPAGVLGGRALDEWTAGR